MKKVFTIAILSCMLGLVIINSCSKSSDSTPAPTNNNNNNNPPPVKDSNIITIDNVIDSLFPAYCSLSGGSSQLYTMSATSFGGNTKVQVTTFKQPAATGTFNLKTSLPTTTTDIQIVLFLGPTGAAQQYTVSSGTATVTVATPPATGIKVSYSSLKFYRTATDYKTSSATLICE